MERRFRATVWPGILPPVTQIDRLGPYRLEGHLLKLDLDEADIRAADIPDELYLREIRDLDLEDASAILDFTNAFGRLGHQHSGPTTEQPGSDETLGEVPIDLDRQIIRLLGVNVPDERTLDRTGWHKEVANHPSVQNRGPMETRLIISDGLQHIDTFRAWVNAFRIMTDTYHQYMKRQADDGDVVHLTSILTELLSPFSPTIQVRYDWEADAEFDPFENTFPRLENVLALQMYRHIASEDVYMPCQNEPCGRLFVHQRGRAEHNQYRGFGVKYCSKNCAKAQVERQRRRREKAKKEEKE